MHILLHENCSRSANGCRVRFIAIDGERIHVGEQVKRRRQDGAGWEIVGTDRRNRRIGPDQVQVFKDAIAGISKADFPCQGQPPEGIVDHRFELRINGEAGELWVEWEQLATDAESRGAALFERLLDMREQMSQSGFTMMGAVQR